MLAKNSVKTKAIDESRGSNTGLPPLRYSNSVVGENLGGFEELQSTGVLLVAVILPPLLPVSPNLYRQERRWEFREASQREAPVRSKAPNLAKVIVEFRKLDPHLTARDFLTCGVA